jgi:Holliday junction resolvase-like predicted endonuclease
MDKDESAAAKFLTSKGYKILRRNFKARQFGEIDIIALHPNKKLLVFIEVKAKLGRKMAPDTQEMVKSYYNCYTEMKISAQTDIVAVVPAGIKHFENVAA